jgi:hypothetical protein
MLSSWERYTLEINYAASPVQARVVDRAGNLVLGDFPTVDIYTRVSSAAENPLTSFAWGGAGEGDPAKKVLDHAFQLQVHRKKNPADPNALSAYHLTTVSMIKAP